MTLPAALLLLAPVASPQGFDPGVLVTSNVDNPNDAIGADVDGDGDLDVVAGSVADDRVAWHENLHGDGSVWEERPISTAAEGLRTVGAADVDGDGDVDVLAASCLDDTVAWWENVGGDGSDWIEHPITVLADCAQAHVVADLDRDGDVDVAVASFLDSEVSWSENLDGVGLSWAHHTISLVGDGGRSVAVADLDGDGDLDVASAWSEDDRIAWNEDLDGVGGAWLQHDLSLSADGAVNVQVGDVDRDGDLDLVACSFGDGVVAWHQNPGGAGSWQVWTVATGLGEPDAVQVADLDRDGDIDVVSASFSGDRIAWHENSAGDGSAWVDHDVDDAADGARRVQVADLDGDGDLDVLGALFDADRVHAYANLAPAPEAVVLGAPTEIAPGLDGPRHAACADVDRDGDPDLVACAADEDRVLLLRNAGGEGQIWSSVTIDAGLADPEAVLAADLDGDGDVDAATASSGDDTVAWHENLDGAGGAWTRHVVDAGAAKANDVFACDLDRDGALDLVASSFADATVAWHRRLPGGGWAKTAVTTQLDGADAARAADLDGDGDPDVLAAGFAGGVRWYANADGAGLAWTAMPIDPGLAGARSSRAVDVDRDGDLDVVAVGRVAGEVTWYENAGDAGAWTRRVALAGVVPVTAEPADLDGDGDADLALALLDAVAWLEGDGGAGWALHHVDAATAGARTALPCDVDRDGLVDLVALAGTGDRVAWHAAAAAQPGATTLLPCAGNPPGSLLVLGGAPAIGHDVVLGVDDPTATTTPGALAVLAVSAALADPSGTVCGLPIPGWGLGGGAGVLQVSLDGAALFDVLQGGPWAGPGAPAAIPVPIPVAPALVGKAIYAQGALVGLSGPAPTIGLTEAVRVDLGP